MSKYKRSVLVSQIQERRVEEKRQEELKSKYRIDKEEKVVIVEKYHWIKFVIGLTADILRRIIQIIIFALATTGLITIIYPESRVIMIEILIHIKDELLYYLGL